MKPLSRVLALGILSLSVVGCSTALGSLDASNVKGTAQFAEPEGAGGILSMADQKDYTTQPGEETLKPKSQTATEHSDAGLQGKELASKFGIKSVSTEQIVLPETPASIEGNYKRTQTVFNVTYEDGRLQKNPILSGGPEYGWADVEILSKILHYSAEKEAMGQ